MKRRVLYSINQTEIKQVRGEFGLDALLEGSMKDYKERKPIEQNTTAKMFGNREQGGRQLQQTYHGVGGVTISNGSHTELEKGKSKIWQKYNAYF